MQVQGVGGMLQRPLVLPLPSPGLTDITRHPTVIPDDEHDQEFWTPLRHSPSFAVLTAHP
ncbi:MAG: hypothetical protein ACRDQ5_14015 [Sciscionella sp.]